MKKLFVEIAPVIQGEGRLVGIPHLMVRTTGCNLRCTWCDTPYTSFNPEKAEYTLKDVEDLIKQFPQIKHTFITGGNPTMFKKDFQSMIELFRKYNYFITVEDNGTTFIEGADIDLFSLSPKMPNSIPSVEQVGKKWRDKHIKTITNYSSYKKWLNQNDYQLKFVIQNENDVDDAMRLVKSVGADLTKVYFMPEGITDEELKARRKWLVQVCISLGVNYTDRMHIIIFGNSRNT